ncbi:putative membrane protein [Babesia divergens]|uniref:Membrane protein n=1 Tax=Babesia divergens TaxID=32595 RepID=A0AAD9G801_BABDI|nr:putative membrane protein [Babesia divergens]
MLVCDVFLVLGTSVITCPKECPFWSQNAVWKNVGVCTKAATCSVYNPVLTYANTRTNVCLPCAVHGCASCAYSDAATAHASTEYASGVSLPDLCLQCAPGYRMADEGRRCYLVNSSIWSKSFYALVATVIFIVSALTLHVYLRPGKFQENLEKYNAAIDAQKSNLSPLEVGDDIYETLSKIMHVDVAGVGGMLYFRFLAFLAATTAVVLAVSLAHSHTPCSDMIRVFKEPFSLDKPIDIASDRAFSSWLGLKRPSTLKQHFLNFKFVDDAIQWSVSQYSHDTARAMRVLYLCVMAFTIVFVLSQRTFLTKYFSENSRVQNFTLLLSRVPPLHSLEDFIETATSVRPKSVAVVYDLDNVDDGLNEFLDVCENGDNVYVNLDMNEEHYRILNTVQPSGMAFAVFSTTRELARAKKSLYYSAICDAAYCDVEPEDVIWPNVGKENIIVRLLSVTALACVTQLLWTVLFFLPYAAYKVHSDSSDIFEVMWLTIFVCVGNALISSFIRRASQKIAFTNCESMHSYLMWMSFATQLWNTGLNVALAHFINYGGRFKVLSVLKDFSMYMRTPTFKVGEEVSISLSLNAYMVDMVLLIPIFGFVFMYYGAPLLTAFLVLTADLNEKQIAQFVRYPRFDFPGSYSGAIANFTCSLLLQFIIRSKLQALVMSLSLLASFFLHYVVDTYILLRKAERARINGFAYFYNAMLLWSLPTGILAACPSYWRWRGQDGKLTTPFVMFFIHMICYHGFMRLLYSDGRRLGCTEVNRSETDYTFTNPIYKLRRMAASHS